jgi:hypothetical protein
MQFLREQFDYLEFPLKMMDVSSNTIPLRLFNTLVSEALRITYHPYVTKYAETIDVMHAHFARTRSTYVG